LSSLGLAEIVLIVEDVPVAARFYEDVVGLTPAHREQRGSQKERWHSPPERKPSGTREHRLYTG